jgi:hypothetical protein
MRRGYKLDISNPDSKKEAALRGAFKASACRSVSFWLVISNVTVSYHSGGPLSTLFSKKVIRGKPRFSSPRFLCILPF